MSEFSNLIDNATEESQLQPLLAYLKGYQAFFDSTEINSFKKLIRHYSGQKMTDDTIKIIRALLSTSFPANEFEYEQISSLLYEGHLKLAREIITKALEQKTLPSTKIILEVFDFKIKSKSYSEIFDLIKQIQFNLFNVPLEIWSATLKGFLTCHQFQEASDIILLIPIEAYESSIYWDTYLEGMVKANMIEMALVTIKKTTIQNISIYKDRVTQIVSTFLEKIMELNLTSFEQFDTILNYSISNQISFCESVLEDIVKRFNQFSNVNDKMLIKLIDDFRYCITARTVENLQTYFMEKNSETVSLTLFNMGIYGKFPLLTKDQIDLPTDYMKKLLIIQQRRIHELQKTINEFKSSDSPQKPKEEHKIQELKKEIIPVQNSPPKKMQDIPQTTTEPELKMEIIENNSDDDWEEFIIV